MGATAALACPVSFSQLIFVGGGHMHFLLTTGRYAIIATISYPLATVAVAMHVCQLKLLEVCVEFQSQIRKSWSPLLQLTGIAMSNKYVQFQLFQILSVKPGTHRKDPLRYFIDRKVDVARPVPRIEPIYMKGISLQESKPLTNR